MLLVFMVMDMHLDDDEVDELLKEAKALASQETA